MNVYYYNVSDYDTEPLELAIEAAFANSQKAKKLNANSKVLIKPNLLAKHVPKAAVTTHPAVLKQVILALHRRGVKNIVLADSPGGPYRPELLKGIYDASGLSEVCNELGVTLNFDVGYYNVKASGKVMREFNFITPLQNADFIINLPKIKTHMMMTMTCGVKNLFGCIPGLQKAELHMRFPAKDLFGEMLVDLYEAINPDLTIADGIVGMEGDGPAGGNPRNMNIVMSSDDALSLDLVAAEFLNIQADDIPYLKMAVKRGLCNAKLEKSELIGNQFAVLENVQVPKGSADATFSGKSPKFLANIALAIQSAAAPRPKIAKAKCIGCAKCAEICPAATIKVENKKAFIDSSKCIRCFCCHEVCPVKAIKVKSVALFKL